jgi:glycosyltransferase involved in cell wall biosynthesis
MTDPRPVLFVTNYVPAYRVGAFEALHRTEDVEFALIGGAVRHGGEMEPENAGSFPRRQVSQREVARLAGSGDYRAVISGLSGRLAPLAAHHGARRARVPFVLWASLWAHPRTLPHLAGYPVVRHLYRDADAIATYGPHVSAYVRRQGARGPVFEAPQAVDNAFWGVSTQSIRHAPFQVGFVGRISGEKGLAVLYEAWSASGFASSATALVLVGDGRFRAPTVATSAPLHLGPLPPQQVRNLYGGCDVVVVPSIPTRDFREPWGLVVNEAFNQGVPVIATDAVGAAAGGLVRHEETGLVVPAGDPGALAAALRRLHDDPALRARLGARARAAVAAYTFEAWAAGISRALGAVGAQRGSLA